MRGTNSHSKFIPYEYRVSDAKSRLEILAGLIDTDGSINGNCYDFVTASKQLADDITFICRSLGFAAYSKETIKTIKSSNFSGKYYRVSISGELNLIPCRVKHKIANSRKQIKNVLRTGFTVIPIGKGDYIGFTVDGDNRYLLDDFTITHNCGKTIVFSKIAEQCVRMGHRVLILAHRGELLEQASDKLYKATGLKTALEKAESSCLNSFYRVVVGSIQSLQRESRLHKFSKDHSDTIIVDEAHHVLSDGYQMVLNYFDQANVLGVTATADRGDMRNLGEYFETLAYEYTLPKAIKSGYLSPIKAVTIPLQIDLSSVGIQTGDFKSGDLGTALDPYLEQIAKEMVNYCSNRKTVVFTPLIETSKKFTRILNQQGFKAIEVNGNSDDRSEAIEKFDKGEFNVICNSMLLTEGWDCPSVDCVIMLRPTKVRSLYCQCLGRGTRLYPGKTELLVLDFLWHTERHELCHPASLIAPNEEINKAMTKRLEDNAGMEYDLEQLELDSTEDVLRQREEALAEQLAAMKKRKRKFVDPLQFEMSIQAEDLVNYVPAFGYEMGPASKKQLETLEKFGIFTDEIENAGKAQLLLDRLIKRSKEGLTTPKQIRFLEQKGFVHVGTWQFEDAKKLINRIAANHWMVPFDINTETYKPGR